MPGSFERRCGRAAALLLLVVLTLGAVTVGDYGATTDEPLRMRSSWLWWQALASADLSGLPDDVRSHYGVAFDLLGQLAWHVHHNLFGGTDEFLARHALCFLVGWLGLLGTYRLGRLLAPQPVPLVALALLILAPRWYGSSFTNPKDIPFAAAWVWAMVGLVRALRSPGTATTLRFAALAAVCAAVRPFGALLLPLGAAALALVAPTQARLRWLARQWALLAGVMVTLLVALWPVLWTRPPWHVLRSIAALSRNIAGSPSLFFGTVHPFDAAPAAYAAVWTVIVLPGVTLVGLVCGLVAAIPALRRRPPRAVWLAWALVGLWIAVPLVAPALRRVSLYDTSRQLLFITPAVSLVAAAGLVAAIRRLARRGRALALVAAAAAAIAGLEVVVRAVRLHPYESLYFGPLVGGLQGARGRFDVAHYAETYREGLTWIRAHAGPGARVHLFGNGSNVGSYYCWKLGLRLDPPEFEYFVAEARQGWEDLLPGAVVHTIVREDTPLLVIKKVDAMATAPGGWLQAAADAPWRPLRTVAGRLPAGTGPWAPAARLAIALDSPRAQRVRIFVGYRGGMRVWSSGQVVLDREHMPSIFAGTAAFPGLVPIELELASGRNWLELELGRAVADPQIGVFFPAVFGLKTPLDAAPPPGPGRLR